MNRPAPRRTMGRLKETPPLARQELITRVYHNKITELAINRFTWHNLPDSVDPRYLELTLHLNGLVVFYNDFDYGFLALRGNPSGQMNMYNNPVSFQVNGNFMVNKTLSAKECVPIYANYLRYPDVDVVSVWAQKLAELDRTVEINTRNMRIPKIFVADESQNLSMQNMQAQIDKGEPWIVMSKSFESTSIQAHDIGINPKTVESLMLARSRAWDDCMTLLGINNSNQDKKERLVSGEVEANDQQVMAARAVSMNARKEACRLINLKFGLDVDVTFNLDIDRIAEDTGKALGNDEEVEDNGDIHTETE